MSTHCKSVEKRKADGLTPDHPSREGLLESLYLKQKEAQSFRVSLFSSLRTCGFTVSAARVGQMNDRFSQISHHLPKGGTRNDGNARCKLCASFCLIQQKFGAYFAVAFVLEWVCKRLCWVAPCETESLLSTSVLRFACVVIASVRYTFQTLTFDAIFPCCHSMRCNIDVFGIRS